MSEREIPGEGQEEQAIRQRVRELTSQALHGRLDPDRVRDVMKSMTSGLGTPPLSDDAARQAFADSLRALNEALFASSQATHAALAGLAAKGANYEDRDLKEAMASLARLQADYVAVANRVAQTASGNLQREMLELSAQAQKVGADASVRAAGLMSDFAHRLGEVYRGSAATGIEAARDYGGRFAMLASGMLAGVADALRDQSHKAKSK